MNYRHIYHAGGFADVMKHFVLSLLLQKLCQKTTPFSVIDTHAGIGLYDLLSEETQKTLEYKTGIEKLLKIQDIDPIFQPYLNKVRSVNSSDPSLFLRYYPGSPLISRSFLRPTDRLFLSELHPQDFETLQGFFYKDSHVKVYHQDFAITLKSLLPPLHKRGLVLIDPPFEKTNEFAQMLKGFQNAYKRFSYGMYTLWYPIKNIKEIYFFYQKLKELNIFNILIIEFLIHSTFQEDRLNGCGLVLINPPWQFERILKDSLRKLLHYLEYEQEGSVHVKWLVKEKSK